MKHLCVTLLLLVGCDAAGDDTAPATCEHHDDPLDVTAIEVTGRTLTLDVQYAGGCETHDLALWWSGALAPSDPPVIPLQLQHDSHGDTCEAAIDQRVVFDLSPLDEVATPAARLDIVMGQAGSRTVASIDYVLPADDTAADAQTQPLRIECGTVR